MQTLALEPTLSPEAAEALAGQHLGPESYDTLLQSDTDVCRPDGSVLLKFRRGLLPAAQCRAAYPGLRRAAQPTNNRGTAAGLDAPIRDHREKVTYGRLRYHPLKADGTRSNTNYAPEVNSGVAGYFDRNVRFPYCRLTAYSMENPEAWRRALPLLQTISREFARLAPERYAAQSAVADRTAPDFLIPGTVFTTVTVNRNWQTAVHQDKGDLKAGFGVMTAFSAGDYDGCYLVFPRWRVAVDLRTTDLLLADVHEWHGNTPLQPRGPFERISLVLYYRAHMVACGSATEELDRAKRREKGEPLHA